MRSIRDCSVLLQSSSLSIDFLTVILPFIMCLDGTVKQMCLLTTLNGVIVEISEEAINKGATFPLSQNTNSHIENWNIFTAAFVIRERI